MARVKWLLIVLVADLVSAGASRAQTMPADSLVDFDLPPEKALVELAPSLTVDERLSRGWTYAGTAGRTTAHSAQVYWDRWSGGVRRATGGMAKFAAYRSPGIVKTAVAGGLRLRWGEGAILGPASGSYPPVRGARTREGFVVSPSLSLWSAQQGFAMTVGAGRWRVSSAAATLSEDQSANCWAAVERGGRHSIGVAAGITGTPQARCISVAGAAPGFFSFETAWMEGVVTGIARATVDNAWAAEFSSRSVASGFAVAAIGARDRDRMDGVALRRRVNWSMGRLHTSVYAGTQNSERRRVRRERFELLSETPLPGGEKIDVQLRQTREWSTAAPTRPSTPDVELESATHWRGRLRISSGDRSGYGQRSTVIVYRSAGDPRCGVVGSWEGRASRGRFDARVTVSNYDLLSGQTGYVVRPGAGGYETVSIVSHRGSDLSFRGAVDLGGRGALQIYAGLPWRAPARFYVHLALRG